MMTSVTLTELLATYKLAFEALGFSPGVASDAAIIVRWCDICGLGGAARVAERLPMLEAGTAAIQSPPIVDEDVLDGAGTTLLSVGIAALEYGYAEHQSGGQKRILVRNVSDLAFAPGLAVVAANRGIDGVLSCSTDGQDIWAQCDGATGRAEICIRDSARLSWPENELLFRFGENRDIPSAAPGKGVKAITPEMLEAALEASLIDGISIDADVWNVILRAAKKRLVPESDRSRERGAGIGANDEG